MSTSSPAALGEGQYDTIAEAIRTGLEWAKQYRPSKQIIAFVRVGVKVTPAARRASAGILTSAEDWQVLLDLEFPRHFAATILRRVSEHTGQVVLLELMVPWEDRLEEAFERKLYKYMGTYPGIGLDEE